MAFKRDSFLLRGDTPGSSTELPFYRIGPSTAPEKVYLQAALHADEQPGTMVLHHLLPMLRQADEQELLRARFVVIPMANPLGHGEPCSPQPHRPLRPQHRRQLQPPMARSVRNDPLLSWRAG